MILNFIYLTKITVEYFIILHAYGQFLAALSVSKTLLTAVMIRRLKLISVDVIDCCLLFTLVHELYPITHVAHLSSDSSFKEHRLILHVNYDGHIQNETLHEHFCFSLVPPEEVQQHKNKYKEETS